MSIEDQIRQKHAAMEQAAREQQVFEQRLREFLLIASGMTNQELEIALGRLADMVQNNKEQSEGARTKGAILNVYYQLRATGIKKQSTLARTTQNLKAGVYMGGGFDEYLIGTIASYKLPHISAPEPYVSEEHFNAQIKLLAP